MSEFTEKQRCEHDQFIELEMKDGCEEKLLPLLPILTYK